MLVPHSICFQVKFSPPHHLRKKSSNSFAYKVRGLLLQYNTPQILPSGLEVTRSCPHFRAQERATVVEYSCYWASQPQRTPASSHWVQVFSKRGGQWISFQLTHFNNSSRKGQYRRWVKEHKLRVFATFFKIFIILSLLVRGWVRD